MIYGWGINDTNLPTTKAYKCGGKHIQYWMCPVYSDWKNMVCRVHGGYGGITVYDNVSICDEWRYLSNFREWVLHTQPNKNWENCVLDKDLLNPSSRVYSPTTCVYVNHIVNTFINEQKHTGGAHLLGVSFQARNNDCKYLASCRYPLNKNEKTYIGKFKTEMEAHKAWQAKKHEYACQLADLQEDPRVAKALRERYAPDKDWTDK